MNRRFLNYKKNNSMNSNIENKQTEYIRLIRLARHGDELALRDFLMSVSHILRAFLTKHIILPELREVVLQDVLIAVHDALHTYNQEDDFSKWLFYVTKYRAVISLKYYQLTFYRGLKYKEFLKQYNTTTELLEKELEKEKSLEFLSAMDKKILENFEQNEFNLKQTAKDLKISKTRLKYRISTIYRKYRSELKKDL